MAEISSHVASSEPFILEEVSNASRVSKNRRNFTSGSANRIKSRLNRSPKRRAGTPEPEQRTYTDDSEKDISDGEYLSCNREESLSVGESESKRKSNTGIQRFFSRKGKNNTSRSKSLEPKTKEPESEDDFDTILRMHKTKEMEDEIKEAEKLITQSKPKIKEELREFVPKEMPPLIIAPEETKKRKRHKSLPLQESQSEEEKPKTPRVKTKMKLMRRRTSTSEDEELFQRSMKSENDKLNLRSRKLINKRLISAKKEGDTSESEEIAGEKDTKVKEMREIETKEESKPMVKKKPGFFKSLFTKIKKEKEEKKPEKTVSKVKERTKEGWLVAEAVREWRAHVMENKEYYDSCMRLKNRCITDLLMLLLLCGCGGFVFRFTEGAFESFYKCGVKRVKRDFIDSLWKNSQYMLEEDWKSQARKKLMEFENQLHSAHEAGMTTYSGQKSWSFLNAVVYCLTIVTTIGYGHISPTTTTGRAITIIYAIFGIPMFLILLADFGKLFTRGIKFLWAFVRRLYYTGSCRRVRKTAPVQEVMKGVQIMYDFAKSRRFTSAELEPQQQQHLRPPEANLQGIPETPSTPNWSTYEINDEFNLPISVAITILLIYIFLGAFMYWMWEEWSFFESFYFVFISMSTIGFGDFVPQHPMYMMLSIVYLIFGLALTSMCINVVQEKLSDTFRQASAKLGTTIGLKVAEEVGIVSPEGLELELKTQPINGPPVSKKGGKKGQGMKTGKNFVRGNKGPRPLMSLRPGPGPRGPPGFMRPGPYGPPPGPPGPFYPPHPMMCPPGGPPGMFPPHGPGPQMWGGPMGPMGPPPFRGPMGPPGPPGPMGPMRRGPTPLLPPQGLRPSSGPSGPRRGGPGPIRKPIGKSPVNKLPVKKPDPKIDFTEDTIDIQSNKLGTAF